MDIKTYKFWPAFDTRNDLNEFGPDALLLFALQMKFGIEDIVTVATTSLTDGGDDKKADLIYIDTESGYAVVAQTYVCEKPSDKTAPANKASDLNTAASWLLNRPIDELPVAIRSHAEELRIAVHDKSIKVLQFWYVHNLLESQNVRDELKTVEHTARSAIEQSFPNHSISDIQAIEIGINTLEDWYESVATPILVIDNFEIPIKGGYKESGSDWQAYVTTVSGEWLYRNFKKYKTKLFSANVRDYLGSRDIDSNINSGIKDTAQTKPDHFWVYNNGITALVHNFTETKRDNQLMIHIEGLSIVNGAQTTGAIGSLEKSPSNNAMIPVRFIMCKSPDTIQDIVRYNNSQNRITAPDFRSNDPIQRRLQKEFLLIPQIQYSARRGGHEDVIRRKLGLLASITAGQALAAFHQDPDIAYHKKTKIWDSNDLYSRYFNDQTTGKHILFVYSLLLAVERKKVVLLDKSRSNTLADFEDDQLNFFRMRGSTFLLSSAIAKCMEVFLEKAIPNYFSLVFKDNISAEAGASVWMPIVEAASAFTDSLQGGLSDGFKNHDAVDSAVKTFRSLVVSTKQSNAEIYKTFATRVI